VWLGGIGQDARAAAAELAAQAAAAALGRAASGLGVAHDPAGRPRLTGSAGHLQVSLSHGRAMAAAAVTAIGPVGVDIEPVRPVDALALARRWFLAAEAAWLARLPPGQRDEAFLTLWTQKEAIAKALGTGLRGGAGLRQPVPVGRPLADPSGLRLTAVPGRPGLAAGAVLAGRAVLAVACLAAR